MASLLRTLTFVTASINASSSSSTNQSLSGYDNCYICKIKVVPSNITPGELTIVSIYKHNTFSSTDLVYNTTAFTGTLVDPIETDGVTSTERNEGFVCRYEDLDLAHQLHIKITNSGTVAKTYTVTVVFDPIGPFPSYVNNAAAIAGGLPVGAFYIPTGVTPQLVCIVV